MAIQIKLSQPRPSITSLACPELPDFTVLVGRNGTAKTRLLQTISNGNGKVNYIPAFEIELYGLGSS